VDKAVQSFFEEGGMTPEKEVMGGHQRYGCPPFTVIQGDVFALEENPVQADAWYDRAAMIALPDEMRTAYVEQLRQQTKPGAVGLLITFAYPKEEMDGPPFALLDEDVQRYFAEGFEVEQLAKTDLEDEKGRGVSWITSSVFRLVRT
jgi:thiopurine S-methyltransferase